MKLFKNFRTYIKIDTMFFPFLFKYMKQNYKNVNKIAFYNK